MILRLPILFVQKKAEKSSDNQKKQIKQKLYNDLLRLI